MSTNPYVLNADFAWAWLAAFALTQVVEGPIYTLALRDFSWPKRIALSLVPSLLTHPIVWGVFVLHWPFGWETHWDWAGQSAGYITMVLAAETFAVVVEGIFLHALRVPSAFLWSLGANLCSVSIGYLLQDLGVM